MRKAIPGYETLYAVDEDGNVWRIGAPRGRPLKPGLRNGYPFVVLCEGGGKKAFSVHRLVLTAFDGPPADGEEARHLNGVKTDNRRSNLAWSTHADNMDDQIAHGTRVYGEERHNAKLTEEAVREIRTPGASNVAMAKKYGVSVSAVEAVKYGRNWKQIN